MPARASRRVAIQMNLRSVSVVLAGIALLALAACQTPIYDRTLMRQGDRLAGPAVIEEAASVTVLRPGQAMVARLWYQS